MVRALVISGATPDMILAAVEATEAANEDALMRRRDADAARQRAKRERDCHVISRDVTVTVRDAPRAHVEDTSLPSLRSEEVRTPLRSPSESFPPKSKKQVNGHRLPDEWDPTADYVAGDFGLSHEQHASELFKFRDYWRSVPGAKARKLDWNATWRNWMRRAAETQPRKANDQPRTDHRKAQFVERLGDIDAAMEAAFEQRPGGLRVVGDRR